MAEAGKPRGPSEPDLCSGAGSMWANGGGNPAPNAPCFEALLNTLSGTMSSSEVFSRRAVLRPG